MAKTFRKTVYGWDAPRSLECGGCGKSVPVNQRESEDMPEGSVLFAHCGRCRCRVVTFIGYTWWIEAAASMFYETLEEHAPGFDEVSRSVQQLNR